MSVLIIDYGMGNLGSVKRALEECGVSEVVISHYENDFDKCTHAILPGVGAFPDAMKNLEAAGLPNRIRKLALQDKIPFLGICLGMQLMADEGEENNNTPGLGLIEGKVLEMHSPTNERIPHVGWNEISFQSNHPILNKIGNNSDFYFVHSYHFSCKNSNDVIAQTPYCGSFNSIVARDNIVGVQFHPEKSSKAGFQLLKNFLSF